MRITQIIVLAALLTAACSGPQARYRKTVERYLTGKAPEGYSVGILSMEELRSVTVADSIRILTEEFGKERASEIDRVKTLLSMTEMLAAAQAADRFVAEAEKRETAGMLGGHRAAIDSLTNLPVPDFYAGQQPDRVLAKVVRCTYSVTVEGSKDRLDETFDFWLSPDGSRVDYKRRAK